MVDRLGQLEVVYAREDKFARLIQLMDRDERSWSGSLSQPLFVGRRNASQAGFLPTLAQGFILLQVREMGRFGSGRYGGGPTVESAVRLDIDDMMQWGGIRAFARLAGEMRFNFYGDQIEVKFESRVGEPWESWLRLKYAMADYWTGEEVEIDDKIFFATTRPPFGGLRWWFVCPHLNRRVRKLYLPLGGRHFWSRRAYELAYASQRETKYDILLKSYRVTCRAGHAIACWIIKP